jgi:hypothetical protein
MLAASRNFNLKLSILLGVTIAAIIIISRFSPVSQDPAFHNFSDNRTYAGIPNFWNVVSNIGFIIVGISGIVIALRSSTNLVFKITFSTLFIAVILTGAGSAYYHLRPDNERLVFDRIPMTLVFMTFLSAAITQFINRTWGFVLLFPLLYLGVGSVLWWQYTESIGAGDLRYYGLVQFFPMLFVPLVFFLFPSTENRKIWPLFGWIIGWYILAKILEHFDGEIMAITRVISGHSLKHIAASIATIYFINVFKVSGEFQSNKMLLKNPLH